VIYGVGTDIVKNDRFKSWQDFSHDKFLRVFSEDELASCQKESGYNFASLGVRFAAKEAFFKALSATLVRLCLTKNEFSFLFVCKHVRVGKTVWDVPILEVDWKAIEQQIDHSLPKLRVELSLSHEQDYSVAFVVICA